MDENYEWDAEFALESELLEALQLYRGAAPARPGSSIAVRDLQRHSECGPPAPPTPVPRAPWPPRRVPRRGRTLPISPQSPARPR